MKLIILCKQQNCVKLLLARVNITPKCAAVVNGLHYINLMKWKHLPILMKHLFNTAYCNRCKLVVTETSSRGILVGQTHFSSLISVSLQCVLWLGLAKLMIDQVQKRISGWMQREGIQFRLHLLRLWQLAVLPNALKEQDSVVIHPKI